MLKKEQQTAKTFNKLKKYYDETWDKNNITLHVGIFDRNIRDLESSYKRATEHLVELLNERSPLDENSIVLDVGCGSGRTLVGICSKYNCRGVGVDISIESIKSAKSHARSVNKKCIQADKETLPIKFIRGSGSELHKILPEDEQFTHIVSQDAMFLVVNKKSLFKNLYRLLRPSGVIAIADFLSETADFTDKEKKLVRKLVNWDNGLSFEAYQKVLRECVFQDVHAENRGKDMITTYAHLAKRMEEYINDADETYRNFKDRYESIVESVKTGKMGWGMFSAQKSKRKHILLAGTHKKSIGRFVAKKFHADGWEVWLYGRSANKLDKAKWHERKCDISSEKQVKKLVAEIPHIDASIFLADSGGHGTLDELREEKLSQFVDGKIVGSFLLAKELLKKSPKQESKIKIVWCAGKIGAKPSDLIAYSAINIALDNLINEINRHYDKHLEAYYIPTTLISPSTLGDEYIAQKKRKGENIKHKTEPPQIVLGAIEKILYENIGVGALVIDGTNIL